MTDTTYDSQRNVTALFRLFKAFALGSMLALLAVVIGIFVVFNVSRDARERDERDRIERSVGSCRQQNATFIHDHNELVRKNQQTLRLFREGIDRPEAKEFLGELIDSYEQNIIPARDCTPAGIEAYVRELGTSG